MAFSTEIGAFGVSHSVSLSFTSDQADEIAAAINKLILLNGGGSTPRYGKIALTEAFYYIQFFIIHSNYGCKFEYKSK